MRYGVRGTTISGFAIALTELVVEQSGQTLGTYTPTGTDTITVRLLGAQNAEFSPTYSGSTLYVGRWTPVANGEYAVEVLIRQQGGLRLRSLKRSEICIVEAAADVPTGVELINDTSVVTMDTFVFAQGEAGVGIASIAKTATAGLVDTYTITMTDGTTTTFTVTNGQDASLSPEQMAEIVEDVKSEISVPTKTSELQNDSGFITSYTETDPVFTASPAATITAQDISDWNGKSDFSGSYTDLTNKPTIPTVNDATLTVQKEGVSVGTFTANDADNVTVNIVETDPVFVASAAHGITSTDITAWNGKQSALTFDDYPTENSNNPVKSGGIYTINTTKQDKMFMETVGNGTTLRAGLNYLHKMVSSVNTLNIILPVPSSIIYLNNTKIEFTTGATPNITFTSTATVTTSLTFEPNTHYLIECYYVPSEWIVDSVDAREKMSNKVTSLSASSTDTEYPSAKAVYDELADKADANAVVTSFNGSTGAVTYTAPVTSVNGSTGAVTISVPTATSDLTNDSGFITAATAPVTSVNGQTGAVTVSTGIPIVAQTASSVEIAPNCLNQWGEIATLTITFATPSDATIVNEYMIEFESGATATTLTLPNTVVWGDSCGAISVEASKIYQISIVGNLATWESWATS